jgi:DNA-binding response OmpR family regulator
MRILVVEDEPRMLELLRKGLYEHGFSVMTAADGATGLEILTAFEFDAIILDIGLPRMSGYGVLKALRAQARMTSVLILTARDTEDDIIRGFELGADDYLTKPFSFPELIARLHSITRCDRQEGYSTISIDDLAVDPIRHKVTRNGASVDLTRLEFLLLVCLARRAGHCVSRRTLMQTLWGPDHTVGPSALGVLMNSLRAKIDPPYRKKMIGTVRGLGYTLSCTAADRKRAPQ